MDSPKGDYTRPKGLVFSTSKKRALAYAKHYFSILGPAGVTLEPSLAEPSWATQPNRKLGDQKKVASRAGKTRINFASLGNGRPGGLQKHCSRARETPTLSKRCAPVYVKQPLGKRDWVPAGDTTRGALTLCSQGVIRDLSQLVPKFPCTRTTF